jgi:isoaspartyl peptidase/L-asparaginase-like protein (Ntn-hydrolase superfamily)
MKVGRAILEAGGSAIEAAVEACVLLEDDPVFNAGTGSVVRTDGSVLTDASLQTGDGRLGFVIAMEDTPNPIRICVDLLDEEINGLAGPGARRWADARGHLKANVIGRPPKDEIGDVVDVGPKPAEIVGDTVGVIARDSLSSAQRSSACILHLICAARAASGRARARGRRFLYNRDSAVGPRADWIFQRVT